MVAEKEKEGLVLYPMCNSTSFESYILKTGGVKSDINPYPHQVRAVNKFTTSGQLILAHGTGTGKTITSILAFETAKKLGKASKALVVVPTGLRTNYAKGGIEKATNSSYQVLGSKAEAQRTGSNVVYTPEAGANSDYSIVGYEMFSRDPVGLMLRTGADTLILDEFHKARNESTAAYQSALAARAIAKNFIGLTASPINNNPAEVATLVNIATNGQFMSQSRFKRTFLRKGPGGSDFWGHSTPKYELINKPQAAGYVNPIVDYASQESLKNQFPKKVVHTIDVPMTDQQKQYYEYIMNKLGPIEKLIARREVNIPEKDLQYIFGRILRARQVMNDVSIANKNIPKTVAAEQTPKTKKLLDDVQEHLRSTPDAQIIVYSNLINSGLDTVAAGLKSRGIPYKVFAGVGRHVGDQVSTIEERDTAVKDFLAGKSKVILISGAGAEGLDLKNATAFFSLDGHWNPERIRQAEARGLRLGGQPNRAPEERRVDIYRYRTTYPEAKKSWFFGRTPTNKATVDQWLYDVALRKHVLNEQLREVVKNPIPVGIKPHKYLRKWYDYMGKEWKYEYPKGYQQ